MGSRLRCLRLMMVWGGCISFGSLGRKDEVNASEVKIGARELPAVTQLFTEHYMVRFLLENSLGAWWAARHPDSPLIEAFEYLRFDDDGNPAAGSFDGWPDSVAEVTAMDPCCGSGHFLTSLFEMLWRMRVEEEGLDPVEAQDAVLRRTCLGWSWIHGVLRLLRSMWRWLRGKRAATANSRNSILGVRGSGLLGAGTRGWSWPVTTHVCVMGWSGCMTCSRTQTPSDR